MYLDNEVVYTLINVLSRGVASYGSNSCVYNVNLW